MFFLSLTFPVKVDSIILCFPPVAKLDIAADSDSEGRGFESLRADQEKRLAFAGLFVENHAKARVVQ